MINNNILNFININGYKVSLISIKFIILISIIVIISTWFLLRPSEDKMKIAEDYLYNKLATCILQIAIVNLSMDISSKIIAINMIDNYKDYEDIIIKNIKEDSIAFTKASIKYSIDNDGLSPLVSRLINKDNIYKLVDIIINKNDIKNKIINSYKMITDEYIDEYTREANSIKELADKAELEKEDKISFIIEDDIECFVDHSNIEIKDDTDITEILESDR